MANQRLMKKVAPVVLSAAVAMTSMPATAFAADFSDTEVTVAEESADIEEASAEAADTDVVEDTEDTDVDVEEAAEDVTADEETSDEELFSAEVSEDESADETGEGQTEGEAYVLMNIPYDDFYKAELKKNDVILGIIALLLGAYISWKTSFSFETVVVTNSIISEFLNVQLALFGIIFTIYSIILAFFNDNMLKILSRIKMDNGEKSKLKEYLSYYEKVLFWS